MSKEGKAVKASSKDAKGSSDAPSEPNAAPPKGSSGVEPGKAKHTRTTASRTQNARGLEVAPNPRFGAQDVDKGLVALALASGQADRAKDALAKQGMKVAPSTLRDWRDRLYPERYLQLQRDVLPALRARAAESHTALEELEGATARKLLARLDAEHKNIPARDLSTALRNLDVGQGIHRTKAAELRGENFDAPALGGSRRVSQILAALRAKGVDPSKLRLTESIDVETAPDRLGKDAIEGTAEEAQ